jgi:hypothetical protein
MGAGALLLELVKKTVKKTRSKKRRNLKIRGQLRNDQSLPRTNSHPLRTGHVTTAERLEFIERVLGHLVTQLEEADQVAGEGEV